MAAVEAYISTLEQGSYSLKYWGDDAAFFHEVADRLTPLATSTLIIENEFVPDLEPELWNGDEVTASITRAGKMLDELDLLPSPFPIEAYLPEADLRHLKQMFNIGGLSYGNVSARKDDLRFWMSASGVDKTQAGRDRHRDPDGDRLHPRAPRHAPECSAAMSLRGGSRSMPSSIS